MGIRVLYPSAETAGASRLEADVIAVHGLNGDQINTWTDRKTKACWLKDFVPHDLPNVRVMTYGYNASAAFGNSVADISDHAKGLLSSLIDKREEVDEARRPIIFIGHSLGGIVIKQALFHAQIEPRYRPIGESTIGIVFLGTPHRGSEKAAYGKVLATVVTSVMRNPSPGLVTALQMNSEALMRLTTDFRFQLPKYQVVSFYETKPMKLFSSLIVEKHSALLDIDNEEQIPVDADHESICKFAKRNDDTYEKLLKRISRMQRRLQSPSMTLDSSRPAYYNKHYCVPYNKSSIFTGRENVLQKLQNGCLPPSPEIKSTEQKRFVLYGIGGSGKTQTCIKFAEDSRERFWGIFWIDASSRDTAQQGFLEAARECGIKEDPKFVKQWLSRSQDSWLLIIDNADDPLINISDFFPIGNRGSILITTRNPDCRIHATAGSCELTEMNPEDAVELLLRSAGIDYTSADIQSSDAATVVKTLSYMALAIVQAGAYIREGHCSITEYCDIYSRRRKELLSHESIQAVSDYRYTVYTTWEVSMEAISQLSGETSKNAIELIKICSFWHYYGITEDIFERAWKNKHEDEDITQHIAMLFYIRSDDGLTGWNRSSVREAAVLLASFSLIKIDTTGRSMSMHPLVHAWVRERLSGDLQSFYWSAASYTLVSSISWQFTLADYQFRRYLVPHVDSCIQLCKDGSILGQDGENDRIEMGSFFSLVLGENSRLRSATELREKVVEASKRILGTEHPDTLKSMNSLANSYGGLGRIQEAMELREKVVEARKRTLGTEHPDTLTSINNLASSYRDLGRRQEATELNEMVVEVSKRTLGTEHPGTLASMNNLAISYRDLGRTQEAMELNEMVIEVRRRTLGTEHPNTLISMNNLAISYRDLGRTQDAMELGELVVEARKRMLGAEHPHTLSSMNSLAISYGGLGRIQEATELGEMVVEASKRTLGTEHPDTLISMNNLAISYRDLGHRQEAMELREKVVEASKRTLGTEHPNTLIWMNNLAISYRDLGRRQEAMEIWQVVVDASKRTLGAEHPTTMNAMRFLSKMRSRPFRLKQWFKSLAQ